MQPNFNVLPEDIQKLIISFVDPAGLLTLREVSQHMQYLVDSHVASISNRLLGPENRPVDLQHMTVPQALQAWRNGTYTLKSFPEDPSKVVEAFDQDIMKWHFSPELRLSMYARDVRSFKRDAIPFRVYIQELLKQSRLVDSQKQALPSNTSVDTVIDTIIADYERVTAHFGDFDLNIQWKKPR